MPQHDPEQQRLFAVDMVRRLRAAGFTAYWAGGCVRDKLLGRTPKDYDVATNAIPPAIRDLFGHRRTLALGAAFGVITVLGPKAAGQVEVATFRRDAPYSDGRHPDSVSFGSPEEDAQRRDFTINGLFYDPLEERVIDFVDGAADLEKRLIRAIGDARERFGEDKLRMLRAVRFAAGLDYAVEPATQAAIQEMAVQITIVSAERIGMEMRRMLEEPGRARAVALLLETGLAAAVFPEIVPVSDAQRQSLAAACEVARRLESPRLPLALAAVLERLVDPAGAATLGRRWRLSNKEIERLGWLVSHHDVLAGARHRSWSVVQPTLVADGIGDLVALHAVRAEVGLAAADDVCWVRDALSRPAAQLDPPPLITGDDLRRLSIPAGPAYRDLLERARAAQLDGELHTPQEALDWVRRRFEEQQAR